MEKSKKIPLLISLCVTALVLAVTMICFYNLDKLTDTSANVLGFGLMFLLTLSKPILICYAVMAGLYLLCALLICVTPLQRSSVKFLLIVSSVVGVIFLIAQLLLWLIATSSPVLIAVTLISEACYIANFIFIKRAY